MLNKVNGFFSFECLSRVECGALGFIVIYGQILKSFGGETHKKKIIRYICDQTFVRSICTVLYDTHLMVACSTPFVPNTLVIIELK